MSESPVAATPAPTEVPEAPGAAPKKLGRILIPIAVVLGVIILGLGAAVVLFMMQEKEVAASSENPLVADLATEPSDAWSYDFASSSDEFIYTYPSYVAVGDTSAVVWAGFDSYAFEDSQEDSYGWYDGYAADYDAGYDAGIAYGAAIEAWFADTTYTVDYPELENFYPAGQSEPADGWWTGFADGNDGAVRGTNAAVEPAKPDFKGEVALLDFTTGDTKWTLDVIGLVEDYDYSAGLSAQAVEGTDYTVFVAREAATSAGTLISVNNTTGEVASQLTVDDFAEMTTLDGGVFVLVAPADDEAPVLSRLDPADLEAEVVWEAEVDDAWSLRTIGDYVGVEADGGGFVFAAADGTEPKWGRDFGDGVDYAFIDGQLVRIEEVDDEYEISGSTLEGKSTWDKSVTAEWNSFDDKTLFIADATTDGIENIMRLNPKTGEEMWDAPIRDEYNSGGLPEFSGVAILVTVEFDSLSAIDVKTGEERFNVRLKDVTGFWAGFNYLYLSNGDELEAFDLIEGDSAWTYGLDAESEDLLQVGEKLFVLDTDKYSLSLLSVD